MVDILGNPALMAGMMVAQGKSPVDALLEGRKISTMQAQRVRDAEVRQALPELVKQVDPSDAVGSLGRLIAGGLPPQAAQQIIGIAQKQAQQESLNNQRAQEQALMQQLEAGGLLGDNLGKAYMMAEMDNPMMAGLGKAAIAQAEQERKDIASQREEATEEELKQYKRTQEGFKTEQGLRKELQGQLKDHFQVRDAYVRIKQSASNPSAAGDLALIFNYMKVLDPGSTVREGEFANAQNAAGVPERIRALFNNVREGTRLTPDQRKDFVGTADNLFKGSLRTAEEKADRYKGIAESYEVNPERIMTPIGIPEGFDELTQQTFNPDLLTLEEIKAEIERRKSQ